MKKFYLLFYCGVIFLSLSGRVPANPLDPNDLEQELKQKSGGKIENADAETALFELAQLQYLRKQYNESYELFYKFSKRFRNSPRLPDSYYWMGLCRYAQGRFSDVISYTNFFLDIFKNSSLAEYVMTLEGDAHFAAGDFKKARLRYHDVIVFYPRSPLMSHVYLRFAQSDERLGLAEENQEFKDFLLKHFPDSYEAKSLRDSIKNKASLPVEMPVNEVKEELKSVPTPAPETQPAYTVQVIALTDPKKAENIKGELESKGFAVYIVKGNYKEKTIYRVRVGKYADKEECFRLMEVISEKTGYRGYPTVYVKP